VRSAVGEEAADGVAQIVLDGPAELLLDLVERQLVRHQARDAVGVLALDGDVQRVHPVSVGGVHVRPRVEQELDELDVAARKRVVERGASAPMLPVVGVGAALDEPRRYLQPRLLVHDRVALASRDLVQPAIKVALGHTLSEEFLDNVTLEAANCPDERVFVVLGRWRGRRVG